jgi:hypothetical protein
MAAACGGHTASNGSDGGRLGGGEAGRSDGAVSNFCPATKPQPGGTCVGKQTCEYGDDPSAACDALMACVSGAWTTTQEPATTGCSTTNPSTCPTTFGDVTQGDACGAQPFDCYYAEARCSCAVVVLQGACIKSDCPAPTWDCDTPATDSANMLTPEDGCPVPRPRIGSSCSNADFEKSCNYGYCQGGVAILCTSNVWQIETIDCPR